MNDPRFSKNVKETYIDLTSYHNHFWEPRIKFNNQKGKVEIIQDYKLFADGTVIKYEKAETTYTCAFDFYIFPNDFQKCNVTVNVVFYNSSEVKLVPALHKYNPLGFMAGQRNVSNQLIDNDSKSLSWKTKCKLQTCLVIR